MERPIVVQRTSGPDDARERRLRAAGHALVAGVDEVGRGPLAGPVTVAAVILDPEAIPQGLADSKQLSSARREALFDLILDMALAVSTASVPPDVVDRIDIRQATFLAMRRAVDGLAIPPQAVLVDGRDVPPLGRTCPVEAVIGGDDRCVSIAAASIVAKVTRDRLMRVLDGADARFGFASHKGYPAPDHRAALARFGPTRWHRRTFQGVAGAGLIEGSGSGA